MTSTTTVTVLFTDVVGNTALRQRLGDAAAERALQEHNKVVRDQIGPCGGREVKTIGDSFMVAFDSARKAVDCAIAIQRALADRNRGNPDEQVQVRIGINTGEATEEKGDLSGTAVNAAKYIEGKAQPDQVLVSETVRALIGPVKDLQFADRGRFRLKGFPERWRLYEVVWREESTGAPAYLERTPFVGRETERAELRRLLEGALGGQGALAMIGGEPGVGKTRLAEELMAEARQRGMTALIGHCYEMEGAPPYIPIVEALEAASRTVPPEAFRAALGDAAGEVARIMPELRRLFPDIPPPLELPPEQERRYLFNSVREFIDRAGRARPLVLVLDDLHWADDSTMLLVQHLAQGVHEVPVLLLGTYRDVELEVARPLARTIRELTRQRLLHRLALKRLPEEGVAAMLRALSGHEPPGALVRAIYGETEGNPFFVEEVFRHFAEEGRLFDSQGRWRADLEVSELDVPEGVRLVITERLEHVGDECRRVLTSAAVIGRAFTFELLEALGDAAPDALLDCVDEGERAHLIAAAADGPARAGAGAGEARFSFAHELIRQTLVSGLSLPRRQRVHLRIAEVIERVYARNLDEHASDIAHHLYQAGAAADPEKTVHYLALAGDQAVAAAAFEDAVRLFEEALSLQSGDDPRGRAELLFKRGNALRSIGHWDEAIADWRQALAGFEEVGDVQAVARVSYETVVLLTWSGRPAEAVNVSRRSLGAGEGQVSADRCRLLAVSGMALSFSGDHAAGGDLLVQATGMAEALGDQRMSGAVLAGKANHHWNYFQLEKQLDAGTQAAGLLRRANAPWELADALWLSGGAATFLGRLDEVEAIGDELEPLAERLGHLGALLTGRRWRALRAWMRTGDLDALGAFAHSDLDLCAQASMPWSSHSYSWLAITSFLRGEWDKVLEYQRRAVELEPAGVWSGTDNANLALLLAYLGERDEALTLIDHLRPCLPGPGHPNAVGSWSVLDCVTEALVVLGQAAEAAKLYPLVKEWVSEGRRIRIWARGLVASTAGMVAGAAHDWPAADTYFEEALHLAHELPVVIAQPETRRWYAWMLIDRNRPGDREKARELLTEAIAMYRKIGMPKHIEMAEALLKEV